MNKEFFEAVALMEKEKGIQADYLYDKISEAIIKAVRKDYNNKDVVACDIDPEAQTMRVYVHLNIVDEITDWDTDILVIDAQEYREDAKAGETLEIDLDTMKFGRIAAQTAKHPRACLSARWHSCSRICRPSSGSRCRGCCRSS